MEGVERKFVGRYCPTVYSPMVLIGLCLYLISFQSGLGPVPWIVNAEVRIFIVINTDNPFLGKALVFIIHCISRNVSKYFLRNCFHNFLFSPDLPALVQESRSQYLHQLQLGPQPHRV